MTLMVVSEGRNRRRSSSSVREDEEYMRQLRAERLRLGLPENPSPQSDTRAQDGAEDCGVACGERRLYTARIATDSRLQPLTRPSHSKLTRCPNARVCPSGLCLCLVTGEMVV